MIDAPVRVVPIDYWFSYRHTYSGPLRPAKFAPAFRVTIELEMDHHMSVMCTASMQSTLKFIHTVPANIVCIDPIIHKH